MEKVQFSAVYQQPMTMAKYDATHIIGYMNEEVLPDYTPEVTEPGEEASPVTAYRYTGTERDGGTVMPCGDATSYPEVTNAIIRSKYTESDEMAIHRHYGNDPSLYADEWREYNAFCESAKQLARNWLGI